MNTATWFRNNFTSRQLLILAFVLIAGLLMRWIQLDARPVHHDESLHAMYGRYFHDFPDIQFYKYDPMLHGPFIYNLMRIAYSTLDSTTFAARAFIGLFGTALMLSPLLFRGLLSGRTIVALTAVIALSPTLIYWARFIREDCLILFWMMCSLWAVCCAPKPWRGALLITTFTLQACLKENIFVTLAIIAGWLAYEFAMSCILSKRDTMLKSIFTHIREYPLELLTGVLTSAFIFYYLFSEGLRYPSGPLDFFTKSFSYWLDQHNKERIRGVFNFHLYTLSWYETPIIVGLLYAWYRFMRSARLIIKAASGYIILTALLCALYTAGSNIEDVAPWKYLKLKDALDVFFAVVLLGHSLLIPTWHFVRQERTLSLWSYLFFAHFFTYSYLGEKVPWLTVYAFVPAVIYGALLLSKIEHELSHAISIDGLIRGFGIALGIFAFLVWITEGAGNAEAMGVVKFGFAFAFGLVTMSLLPVLGGPKFGALSWGALIGTSFVIWSIRASILTNFTYAGHAREFISQVHTTPDFNKFVLKIRSEIEAPLSGTKPTICASGEMTWPITWYFVGISEYMFPTGNNKAQCDAATYRFVDKDFADKNPTPAGYTRFDLPLRGWWVPDMNRLTPRAFLNYALNHTPWSDTGFSWTTVYVKQKS